MSHTAQKVASTTSSNKLSALDALFVYIVSAVAPMHVGWVCIYDGIIHLDKYQNHIAGKLHRIPRYRQRLSHAPLGLAHPAWEDNPGFALKNHIKEISLNPPGTTTQLRHLSGKLFRDRLDG